MSLIVFFQFQVSDFPFQLPVDCCPNCGSGCIVIIQMSARIMRLSSGRRQLAGLGLLHPESQPTRHFPGSGGGLGWVIFGGYSNLWFHKSPVEIRSRSPEGAEFDSPGHRPGFRTDLGKHPVGVQQLEIDRVVKRSVISTIS